MNRLLLLLWRWSCYLVPGTSNPLLDAGGAAGRPHRAPCGGGSSAILAAIFVIVMAVMLGRAHAPASRHRAGAARDDVHIPSGADRAEADADGTCRDRCHVLILLD